MRLPCGRGDAGGHGRRASGDKHPQRGTQREGCCRAGGLPVVIKQEEKSLEVGDGLGARGQGAKHAGRRGERCAWDEGSQGCSSL